MKKWLYSAVACIILSPLTASYAVEQEPPTHDRASLPSQEEWITIFVHGTVGKTVCPRFLGTYFRESIDGTAYKRETARHRNGPAWCKNHPAQEIGLRPIVMQGPVKRAAQLFAHLYDELQRTFYPHQHNLGYYTYGWSGLINPSERERDAKRFYQELKALVEHLSPQHPNLKIRLVGYSHGANVCLNLAMFHADDPTPTFVVDELVTIACPTQRETDCYIAYPLFKKAYNLYASSDCIQKKDCFSTIRFFSGRKFRSCARCLVEHAVQQVEIKVTMAAEKDLKRPACLRGSKRINRSPGHIEFWHFAELCDCDGDGHYDPCYESRFYRYYYPLAPLPTAALVPAITATVDRYLPYRNNVLEIQPDTGMAVVRQKHTNKKTKVPFISVEQLEALRAKSLPHLRPKRDIRAVQHKH